jgi:3'(2'), 5'-bisphosphate nucleotidase
LLEYALHAAQGANAEILAIYASGSIDVTFKGDGSPVTKADLRAHVVINNILEVSGLNILSEEAFVPYENCCKWKRYWWIDPLDGTKDFMACNDEFTVNIALIENGVPIIGVVAAPAITVC